ncbi:MAG TPA: hypothetical protein VF198_14930 [Vicinamibacterales bacterium]
MEFLVEASVYFDDPGTTVVVRLVDPVMDRKVWAREYDSGALGQDVASRIATDTADAIAGHSRERFR